MKTLIRMVVAAAASVLVFDSLVRLGASGEPALAVAILVACVVFAALGRPRWTPTPLLDGDVPKRDSWAWLGYARHMLVDRGWPRSTRVRYAEGTERVIVSTGKLSGSQLRRLRQLVQVDDCMLPWICGHKRAHTSVRQALGKTQPGEALALSGDVVVTSAKLDPDVDPFDLLEDFAARAMRDLGPEAAEALAAPDPLRETLSIVSEHGKLRFLEIPPEAHKAPAPATMGSPAVAYPGKVETLNEARAAADLSRVEVPAFTGSSVLVDLGQDWSDRALQERVAVRIYWPDGTAWIGTTCERVDGLLDVVRVTAVRTKTSGRWNRHVMVAVDGRAMRECASWVHPGTGELVLADHDLPKPGWLVEQGEAPVDNAWTRTWDDVLRLVRDELGYWPADDEADGAWLRKGTTGPFGNRDVPYGWPDRSWWSYRRDADGGGMFVLEVLDLEQDEVDVMWSGARLGVLAGVSPAWFVGVLAGVSPAWFEHWKHEARCLRAGDDVRIEWHVGSHVATARSRASKTGGPKVLVAASVVEMR